MKTLLAWITLPIDLLRTLRSIDKHLAAIRRNLNDVSRTWGNRTYISTDSTGNPRFDRECDRK